MTKSSLKISVVLVCIFLSIFAALAWFVKVEEFSNLYGFIKDFSSIVIGICAAYLAYCFQRRMAFLTVLRELWKEIVQTKNILINYTYKENPDQKDFEDAQQKLHITIDLVRSAFKNIDESKNKIGYYPFEPLHDMRRAFGRCSPNSTTTVGRKQAREELEIAWHALKHAFLQEFPRARPAAPLVIPGMRDPRR